MEFPPEHPLRRQIAAHGKAEGVPVSLSLRGLPGYLVGSCTYTRFLKKYFGTGADPVMLPRNRRVTELGPFGVFSVSSVM